MMSLEKTELLEKANQFLINYYEENELEGLNQRIEQITDEVDRSGTYQLTESELSYGAKLAWRNSNRCIGRLFWKSLKVRDRRELSTPEEIFEDLLEHLDFATNGGKIRSTVSVYPSSTDEDEELRIWNKQLIRFAGYELPDGRILGDPDSLELTRYCQSRGWNSPKTAFDILPLVIQKGNRKPKLFSIPENKVLRVPILHPDFEWVERMNIQWYAVPLISDMRLEIGGISFTCAPFNGWYMLTEIAVRNLADSHRYNLLPQIAEKMQLDLKNPRSLWKDKALLVLQEAVLHSFQEKGVSLVDHHTASEQFLEFCRVEGNKGREVQAEWSWIVPPTSGSLTGVFHKEWQNEVATPNFFYRNNPLSEAISLSQETKHACPYHLT
jgi:nitric-oxide synthase